jgi:branched-chain amino acid aminotransferase
MPQVWLNGQFVDAVGASVPIGDPGLLHAAGVFTTMRADGGRVFRLGHHLARLRDSCTRLGLPLPFEDTVLHDVAAELLRRNELSEARMRLTVTRGSIFLTAVPLEPYPAEYYTRGITVIVLDQYKLNPFDPQAGHKTLNYLSRLTALRLAAERGAAEALWFSPHNYLQSGSVSNVFLVKSNTLRTPPIASDAADQPSAVLPGITRAAILEIAAEMKIPIELKPLTINDLLDADEVFLTNSIMKVMPVCRIERKAVGRDKPGPLTQQLSEQFEKLLQSPDR